MIVNDSDGLDGGGVLSASPHPSGVNSGVFLNFVELGLDLCFQ